MGLRDEFNLSPQDAQKVASIVRKYAELSYHTVEMDPEEFEGANFAYELILDWNGQERRFQVIGEDNNTSLFTDDVGTHIGNFPATYGVDEEYLAEKAEDYLEEYGDEQPAQPDFGGRDFPFREGDSVVWRGEQYTVATILTNDQGQAKQVNLDRLGDTGGPALYGEALDELIQENS